MSVEHDNSALRENLADLQAKSLVVIELFSGVMGYVWLTWIVPPVIGEPAPIGAWIGVGLLLLSVIISYALKERHLSVATHLLVWGMLAATTWVTFSFLSAAALYLFVVPIIFASVLFSQPAFVLTAVVASLIIVAIGLARLETPLLTADVTPFVAVIKLATRLLSGDAALPLGIMALVTLASWLSSRNLHTALIWVLSGYDRARHNEQLARERQAELRQAMKALDESTHRLERANYMLTLARDQAEEARRLKQRFAQTISHELRTPLNLIVGFTELMTRSPEHYESQLSPLYMRDLTIVHNNACHLETLVNDVLDLALIEAAQMSLLPEETDPAALVQEAVDTARSLVEARGLALHTDVEQDLPKLCVDPTRIRQVLFNLLNNAARFTDEGTVTVSVRQQGEEMIFAVVDTGVGIAPEDTSRIFDEFHQADGSMRRRHSGAGLGLAISKQFVELHAGRIWVESQLGIGSTFYFSLPVNRVDLDATSNIQSMDVRRMASAKGTEEPVLLAVTRSPSAGALLTRYVRGCHTVVAPDLEQAHQAARSLMPQVVIIDKADEDLQGVEPDDLAQEWGLPHTPFITCPLPGEEPLRQRLAVDGYLVKPVSPQTLWDVLRQYGEKVDNVLVVDDDRDFVRLLSRILENPVRPYQVHSAYSGWEGLALMRHCRPDLILLDLMLPDIDGFQVIERVRSNPAWEDIPIVVVSAQDEMDNRQALTGPVMISKAEGVTPSEVVRWICSVVDTTTRAGAPVETETGPK